MPFPAAREPASWTRGDTRYFVANCLPSPYPARMAKPRMQWHPLLGWLLRRRVGEYYELLTSLPVGEMPRQADIVLLRRTGTATPPFSGLWRHLTTWNVLEYKGPTVAPRRQHLPLLIEVGLGIHRRLNAESANKGLRPRPEPDVSFWYLANRLGRGFLQTAESLLGGHLEALEDGVWRSTALQHPCFLVSAANLPVDEDSLPLHVLGQEPVGQQVAVGQFLVAAAKRVESYGGVFAALHPAAWKEVKAMARSKGLDWDLRPIVEELGLDKVIEKLGKKEVIEQIGKKEVIEQIGKKEVIEQIGKKEVIEQIGKKEVIEQIGKKDVLQEIGIDDIVESLPPARRRALLQRLSARSQGEQK
jgi:hypothetical protein